MNVSGEILLLKDTINTMVDQAARSFASEVARVARESVRKDDWEDRPMCRESPERGRI